MTDLRCRKCGKKLGADLEGKVAIVCPRCGVFNQFNGVKEMVFSEDRTTITKTFPKGENPGRIIEIYEENGIQPEADGVWEFRSFTEGLKTVQYTFESRTVGLEGVEYYRYRRTPSA